MLCITNDLLDQKFISRNFLSIKVMANGRTDERDDSLREYYDDEDDDDQWWRDDGGKEEKKKEGSPVFRRVRSEVLNTLKTLAIVILILLLIIGGLVLYTGSWPPVAVVESGSMMQDETDSELGVLDTADLILVKDIERKDVHKEITTWVDKEEDHYGTWGDVIVYKADGGDDTPILHRAVCWAVANLTNYDNSTMMGATYDIPSVNIYGAEGTVLIHDYPDFHLYDSTKTYNVQVDFGRILNTYRNRSLTPQSGFITKGDANLDIDQPGLSLPIQPNWVLAKAVGEIPWYGIVNMKFQGNTEPVPPNSWGWFIGSLAVIIITPFALDFSIRAVMRSRKKKRTADKPQEAKIIAEEQESRRLGGRDEWDDFDERFVDRGYAGTGQRKRKRGDEWDDFDDDDDDEDDVAQSYWDWYDQQEESQAPPPPRRDEYEERPRSRNGRRNEERPRRRKGRRREEYREPPPPRQDHYQDDHGPPPPPWMQEQRRQQEPRYDDDEQYFHEPPPRQPPPRGGRPPPQEDPYGDDWGDDDEEEEDWGDAENWDDDDIDEPRGSSGRRSTARSAERNSRARGSAVSRQTFEEDDWD